jgi:hypothetical protein
MLRFIGKTKAAVLFGYAVDVTIWYRSSATGYTSTSVDMTGVMNIFGSVANGRYVRCDWEDDGANPGRWVIDAAACQ